MAHRPDLKEKINEHDGIKQHVLWWCIYNAMVVAIAYIDPRELPGCPDRDACTYTRIATWLFWGQVMWFGSRVLR